MARLVSQQTGIALPAARAAALRTALRRAAPGAWCLSARGGRPGPACRVAQPAHPRGDRAGDVLRPGRGAAPGHSLAACAPGGPAAGRPASGCGARAARPGRRRTPWRWRPPWRWAPRPPRSTCSAPIYRGPRWPRRPRAATGSGRSAAGPGGPRARSAAAAGRPVPGNLAIPGADPVRPAQPGPGARAAARRGRLRRGGLPQRAHLPEPAADRPALGNLERASAPAGCSCSARPMRCTGPRHSKHPARRPRATPARPAPQPAADT